MDTRVYAAGACAPATSCAGPAVIEQPDSTTLVPPGARARVDEIGNLVLEDGDRWQQAELDAITLSVLGGAFKAIATQMAQVLYRMSYSSIIRESEDLGCGIFFPDGAELCESDTTPMHVGSIPGYLEGIISVVGDDVHEGDVFLHNDPYLGASHTPDLCVAIPIFHDGRLCAWSCANGHLADVGGMSPGLMVHPVDVWAEGHHYTALRIEDRRRAKPGAVEAHLGQHAHADAEQRRHRGADRRVAAGARPVPGADRQVRLRHRVRRRRVLARLLRAQAPLARSSRRPTASTGRPRSGSTTTASTSG